MSALSFKGNATFVFMKGEPPVATMKLSGFYKDDQSQASYCNLFCLKIIDQRSLIGGPRSRPGPSHRPLQTRSYSRLIIENYYLMTERFHFNPCSFFSIYRTGLDDQETHRPTACVPIVSCDSAQPIKSLHSDKQSSPRVRGDKRLHMAFNQECTDSYM